MFPPCWNIYNSSYLQLFNNKWQLIFYYFLKMNGCNGEGNLLTCNKYFPELGVASYDNTEDSSSSTSMQSPSAIFIGYALSFLASDNNE